MNQRRWMIFSSFLLLAMAAVLLGLVPLGGDTAGSPDSGHADHAEEAPSAAVGDLEITAAWARAMLPGQPAGGGYLSVTNTGAEADRLIGASSPSAGKVEIHEMKVENEVMTMRPVEGGLEIAPGATVELKPGGFHLMFMQVTEPFEEGGSVPLTLEFEKTGKVDFSLPVKSGPGEDHSGHGG